MNQGAVTIPKNLTRLGELVVVPRRDYEEYLNWRRNVKFFSPTAAEKRDLKNAHRDFARGNFVDLEALP